MEEASPTVHRGRLPHSADRFSNSADLHVRRPLFLTLMALAGVGTVLTAVYFLAMLRRVDFGLVADRWRDTAMRDVAVADVVAWTPLVVLAVAIGVWPRIVLAVGESAVSGLLR